MKLQKLWDIEKVETGASLIGTKKRAGWLLPGEKKTRGLGGVVRTTQKSLN
jgi:hypothetical protein